MAERFPNLKKAMDEGRVPNPDSLPDPTKRDLRCLPPDHPDRLAEVAGEQVSAVTRCGGKPGKPGEVEAAPTEPVIGGGRYGLCPGCPDCRPGRCPQCGSSDPAKRIEMVICGTECGLGPCPHVFHAEHGTGVAP